MRVGSNQCVSARSREKCFRKKQTTTTTTKLLIVELLLLLLLLLLLPYYYYLRSWLRNVPGARVIGLGSGHSRGERDAVGVGLSVPDAHGEVAGLGAATGGLRDLRQPHRLLSVSQKFHQ